MSEIERRRIGSQVTMRRKQLGWTLKDVAARTGRQPSRISEIETGRANSTVDALVRVGDVVGLRLLFVPAHRFDEILTLLGREVARTRPVSDAYTVFDEVFIPTRRTMMRSISERAALLGIYLAATREEEIRIGSLVRDASGTVTFSVDDSYLAMGPVRPDPQQSKDKACNE